MILNKGFIRSSSKLLQQLKFNYVSQDELYKHLSTIDESTTFGKLKWNMEYIKFIMKSGFKEAKDDISWFKSVNEERDLNNQDNLERYYTIKQNCKKLLVPIILNVLPMSGLLIILMIKYSPETLPTWIKTDKDDLARLQKNRQIMNKTISQNNISKIDLETASIQQLKILSRATSGRIVDGTIMLNRMFNKNFSFASFPMNYFSRWMLQRHIRNSLLYNKLFHDSPNATVQQRIKIIANHSRTK